MLEVFPGYLESLVQAAHMTPVSLAYAATPGVGPAKLLRSCGVDDDFAGCYALFEGDRPVYVGISKSVFQRLSDHVKGDDHLTATLVYHMAKHHHPHGTTAARAMTD
ncbi:excinuclease ABC subunit C, partial [bacterium]|nr:excinuclease ABC subunit C [bacterium]